MSSTELMLNRLAVLLQIIGIPIYFLYFSIKWRENIIAFFDELVSIKWLRPVLPEWMVWFLVYMGIPILFSLPWLLGSILRANRIADAYSLMGRALGKVRIDQKIFYGLNAAFTLVFFVFPFGSPIITIIGIFVVFRMVAIKLLVGRVSKLSWIIPSLLVAFYPTLIAFAFYINYIQLISTILIAWTNYIDIAFGFGLSLAIAISLGNFLYFLLEGRQKYEGVDINEGFILMMKFIFFGVLALLYFNGGEKFVNGVNLFAVILGVLEMVLRRVKDMQIEGGSRGMLMVFIFSLVNMGIKYLESYTNFIQSIVIIISGLIFFILFALSYKYADDPELI